MAFNARGRASDSGYFFRSETEFHIGEHGEPGKQRGALKDHGNAFGRSFDRRAMEADGPFCRFDETGDDAQKRGLAAAGAAEEADDLAFVQSERDMIEHQGAFFAGAGAIALANVFDFEKRLRCNVEHDLNLNPAGTGVRRAAPAVATTDG